jgi:hypothetical protein
VHRWTIHCDTSGCSAAVSFEHEEASEALLGAIAKAVGLRWFVASSHDHGVRVGISRGAERDHCEKHKGVRDGSSR